MDDRYLISSLNSSTCKKWKNLATVASLGKQKSKCNINKVTYENENISDTKKIADVMNNYFCTIGDSLQKNIYVLFNCLSILYAPIYQKIVCFARQFLLLRFMKL